MNNLAFLHPQQDINTHQDNDQPYDHLKIHHDSKNKIAWALMSPSPRPCYTVELLDNLKHYINSIKAEMALNSDKFDYYVLASDMDGVYNLGGDLNLFSKLIKEKDRAGLLDYATRCIYPLYQNIVHFESELTTISLVQGDALGGGFEAALSTNVLIAERGSKMGLPEVLFNLFPGMGAFSILSRKVGAAMAEKIIFSGQLYTAEALYEMGIVDVLAEEGEGELALYQYIKSANRAKNSHQAMRKVKDLCNPITHKELMEITNIWVDSALNLTDKNLRMMERLVQKQNTKI